MPPGKKLGATLLKGGSFMRRRGGGIFALLAITIAIAL
jgi:hypothetical protein